MMGQDHNKAAVLRANAGFYDAFSRGDIAAMRELWAKRADVTCFHPGSALLRGQRDVLGAWEQILREPVPLELRCDEPQVQLHGAVAIVTCYEGNGAQPAHLAATNVFVLENETWKMLHHQAGPLAQARPPVFMRTSKLN